MIFFAHQETPAKVNVQKEATHPKRDFEKLKTPAKVNNASPNVAKGTTPENPWLIGESGQSSSSSDIDISPGSASKHMAKEKEN